MPTRGATGHFAVLIDSAWPIVHAIQYRLGSAAVGPHAFWSTLNGLHRDAAKILLGRCITTNMLGLSTAFCYLENARERAQHVGVARDMPLTPTRYSTIYRVALVAAPQGSWQSLSSHSKRPSHTAFLDATTAPNEPRAVAT